MLQPYQDILDAMTDLTREMHYFATFDNPHTQCITELDDNEMCTCIANPLWWDENGVPRFAKHHPSLCPDIGADEVILLQISCQSCDREFPVQMSWNQYNALDVLNAALNPNGNNRAALSWRLRAMGNGITGAPHYGDPPYHEDCRAGVTMNCWDLRVLEFWRRVKGGNAWARVPELEIELPDAADHERTGEDAP